MVVSKNDIADAVAKQLLSDPSFKKILEDELSHIVSFNSKRAARLLGISPDQLRARAIDRINFGERCHRWTLADLRKFTENHRSKHIPKP